MQIDIQAGVRGGWRRCRASILPHSGNGEPGAVRWSGRWWRGAPGCNVCRVRGLCTLNNLPICYPAKTIPQAMLRCWLVSFSGPMVVAFHFRIRKPEILEFIPWFTLVGIQINMVPLPVFKLHDIPHDIPLKRLTCSPDNMARNIQHAQHQLQGTRMRIRGSFTINKNGSTTPLTVMMIPALQISNPEYLSAYSQDFVVLTHPGLYASPK